MKLIGGCMVLIVGVAVVQIWVVDQETEAWKRFAEQHHCSVTGKMAGNTSLTTGIGVMPNGQVGPVVGTTVVPEKTGYQCDDGVTYWR